MQKITIETKSNRELIDITNPINNLLKKSKIKTDFCHIFLLHTTAGLITAYLDPESELSIIDAFPEVALYKPVASKHQDYSHAHTHFITRMPDHVVASFLGSSLSVPVENGSLVLGELQRIVLVELNGPRKREVVLGI